VDVERWCRERCVLVGDAAYCPSLLSGAGASSALIGAVELSERLLNAEEWTSTLFHGLGDTLKGQTRASDEGTLRLAAALSRPDGLRRYVNHMAGQQRRASYRRLFKR
jgi:2-polyprenyl-6-methoxyphenol hydroxylase-like FAD-dependent oxidoreductase